MTGTTAGFMPFEAEMISKRYLPFCTFYDISI